MKDVEDAVLNVCDFEQIDFCREARADCDQCHKVRCDRVHPYLLFLLDVRNIKTSGCPIAADDLTLDQWQDLATVDSAVVKAWRKRRGK